MNLEYDGSHIKLTRLSTKHAARVALAASQAEHPVENELAGYNHGAGPPIDPEPGIFSRQEVYSTVMDKRLGREARVVGLCEKYTAPTAMRAMGDSMYAWDRQRLKDKLVR